MRDLSTVFKAYDVRGTYPDQIDEELCRAIGSAVATFCGGPTLLMARDMRPSGTTLTAAFGEGANAVGVDVVDAEQSRAGGTGGLAANRHDGGIGRHEANDAVDMEAANFALPHRKHQLRPKPRAGLNMPLKQQHPIILSKPHRRGIRRVRPCSAAQDQRSHKPAPSISAMRAAIVA